MKKENIFQIITQHTCSIIPELEGHPFTIEDRLVDLGANSIDRAEIITMTLESLSLKTPISEMAGTDNIGELTNLFYEKL